MPELAEVEYYRKQWDSGLRGRIVEVCLHAKKRIFRGADTRLLSRTLAGAQLLGSEARGKQMLFRFSRGGWLGIHLGMTGALRTEPATFRPDKHDHLLLRQRGRSLVYRDARQFGRIRIDVGAEPPEWWRALPPAVTSPEFTLRHLREILVRRRRAPVKAVLLDQKVFLGVGNWMADEILWQTRLDPRRVAGNLTTAEERRLLAKAKSVCKVAMETIGSDWNAPPPGWLIHVRSKSGGLCPKHKTVLQRAQVATRTTAWCARCQPPDAA